MEREREKHALWARVSCPSSRRAASAWMEATHWPSGAPLLAAEAEHRSPVSVWLEDDLPDTVRRRLRRPATSLHQTRHPPGAMAAGFVHQGLGRHPTVGSLEHQGDDLTVVVFPEEPIAKVTLLMPSLDPSPFSPGHSYVGHVLNRPRDLSPRPGPLLLNLASHCPGMPSPKASERLRRQCGTFLFVLVDARC